MAEKKTSKKKEKTPQTLVIVESPTKAHTIEKYLGPGYVVRASVGHLIDLPKSRMAIDIENGFQPEYITVRGKAKLLKELQKEAKKSQNVLLASDNDREGEAIAWHLNRALKDKTDAKISRIVFNEITPTAITEAVKNPREIVESKVNAQKARRVLDRLVGYNLSPLLWTKVKNGLSAGRVQSVALRLICEREKEVEDFLPEEYWSLDADFTKGKSSFTAQLVKYAGEAPELKSEDAVKDIMEKIKNSPCTVSSIKKTEKTVRPKAPFTTSKLQQAAANRLGFTSRKTMQIAQQLYEGIQIGSNHVGLITYMRTDSVRISETALADVRDWLSKNHPAELPEEPIHYAVGKSAQDAHEGIRPTYVSYTPESIKEYLSHDQFRLYSIIWERFVSSQMNNAKMVTTSVEITAGDATFRVAASKIAEKGFYQVIKLLSSKEDKSSSLPAMKEGEELNVDNFHPEQHFTQGPARYTDASIVRMLEEKGIGRPSTYATIISVLLDRYYVTRSNKQLCPTQLGRMISNILVESFPDVLNVNFTAEVENTLDEIEKDNQTVISLWGDEYFKRKLITTVSQHHIYGFYWCICLPFTIGVPFRRKRVEFPSEFEDMTDTSYVLVSTPAFIKRTVEVEESLNMKDIFISTSGGALSEELAVKAEKLFGFCPMEGYGSTETSGIGYRQQSRDGLWITPYDCVEAWIGENGCLIGKETVK